MIQRRPSGRSQKAPRKVSAPFRCRLVIMAREPVAGRVKTRLARAIGTSEAVRFYRATSRAVIHRLSRQPHWQTIIAVTPDARRSSPVWPRHVARIGQGGGDLGQRMQRPLRVLGLGPVCIIGTDIPAIEPQHIRRAFQLLGSADVVFGPAEDGGFWLVGMRRRPRVLAPFAGVRWSHAETLADVEGNLESQTVYRAAMMRDVDEPDDLAGDGGQFGRLVRGRVVPERNARLR